MYWVNFLHIYQPPIQYPEVLGEIVRQSYRPLLALLARCPKVKVVLNINGSLTEQLAGQGFDEIIRGITDLAEAGRIEFTGSACYHAFLPKIPENEILRQIRLNEEVNKRYFGNIYRPLGFFPPEMAYSAKVGKIASLLGYKWVILEEGLKKDGDQNERDVIFVDSESGLNVFFRDKEASLKVAFAQVSEVEDLVSLAKTVEDGYLITAMDGETFGHHRPGQMSFLEKVFSCQEDETRCAFINSATISKLTEVFGKRREIELDEGCWAVTDDEFLKGVYFPRWDYPGNKVQELQWGFLEFAIKAVEDFRDEASGFWQRARELLDKAMNSDQFYWASGAPYWHFFMIERGAALTRDTVFALPQAEAEKKEAEEYYEKIVETARETGGEKIVTY